MLSRRHTAVPKSTSNKAWSARALGLASTFIHVTTNKKGLCGVQRVQPETRTYNTAIIACNMCNQSAKALQGTPLTAVTANTSFVNTMRC